jgi:hypothetical protein
MSTETIKALLDERKATKTARERSGQTTECVDDDIKSLQSVIGMLERIPSTSEQVLITPELMRAYMIEKSNEFETWSTSPKECTNPTPVVEQLTRIMHARLPGAFAWLTSSNDTHAPCREKYEREHEAWIRSQAKYLKCQASLDAYKHDMQNKINLLQKTHNKH